MTPLVPHDDYLFSTFGTADFADLDESTSPAVIASVQRADVQLAWACGHTDPERISVVVCLPVWSVKRHLGQLGLGPVMAMKACARRDGGRPRGQTPPAIASEKSARRVAGVLERCGPLTVARIRLMCHLGRATVEAVLRDRRFAVVGSLPTDRRPAALWGLAKERVA